MSSETLIADFFSAPDSKGLKERELLQKLVTRLPADSSILYDLTFHAAFAKRIFDIIRREGPHTQGFERMQQSFMESVGKIRGILEESKMDFTEDLISSTPESRARLSRLIEDLALLKNWLVSQDGQ
jgi:hypothetical protein